MTKPSIVSEAMALVAPAESAFTSRWRLSTLARLDPELAKRLEEQRMLYDHSLVAGTDADTKEQAGAMVRGWRAAVARMEAPLINDDAYFVGMDVTTHTCVVIGHAKQSVARAQMLAKGDMAGRPCIFMTPDEIARLIGGFEALKATKALFPDAEVVELFPRENVV